MPLIATLNPITSLSCVESVRFQNNTSIVGRTFFMDVFERFSRSKYFQHNVCFLQLLIVSGLIEEVIIDKNVFCYYIPGSVVTSYENKCFMLNSSHTFVHATLAFSSLSYLAESYRQPALSRGKGMVGNI